jgi:hypothetical protein
VINLMWITRKPRNVIVQTEKCYTLASHKTEK